MSKSEKIDKAFDELAERTNPFSKPVNVSKSGRRMRIIRSNRPNHILTKELLKDSREQKRR